MRLLLVLGLTALTTLQPQATPASTLLTAEQITQDLDLFQAALFELHPEFVSEARRAEIARFLDDVRVKAQAPATPLDLYRLLAPAAAVVRDGHTPLRLPAVFPARDAWRLLPLEVYVQQADRSLWVRSSEDARVPVGSRILSINGRDAAALLSTAALMVPRDGTGEGAPLHALGRRFRFSESLAAMFDDGAEYRIEVIRPGAAKADIVTLPGRTPGELAGATAAPDAPALAFDSDGRVAVLTLTAFGATSGARVREAFRMLGEQRTPGLIIDLRNNGGGSDEAGKDLFAQLAAAPFAYYRDLVATAAPARPEFAMVASRLQELAIGADGKRHVPSANLGQQMPASGAFTGPVAVLIDGGTFSSAAEFASVAKARGRAILVGEESGGGSCGNNSGVIFPVTLPHSKLRLSVPLVRYELAVTCERPSRGVAPDYAVAPSAADVLAGRDPQMEQARSLVRQKTQGLPVGSVPAPALPPPTPAGDVLGDSPQARHVRAFVDAFNGGEAAYEAMRLEHFDRDDPRQAERRLEFYRVLRADFGTLQIVRVLKTTAAEIHLAARKKSGEESQFIFRFTAAAPFKITGFSIETP